MNKGSVKWYDSVKGYGFIETENKKDIFVHRTGVVQAGYQGLREGDQVTFEIKDGDKGPQAINVKVVK